MTSIFGIQRSIRWQFRRVEVERERVAAELNDLASPADPEPALQHCLLRITSLEEDLSAEGQLSRLVYAIAALTIHVQFGGLRPGQVQRLFVLAEATLQTERIQPEQSRLAFFYSELLELRAKLNAAAGETWAASWALETAHILRPDSDYAGSPLAQAQSLDRALRLGQGSLIRFYLSQPEPTEPMLALRLLRLKALRLCGEWPQAEALAHISKDLPWSESQRLELEWENSVRLSLSEVNIEPLARLCRTGKKHHLQRFFWEYQLWARAAPQRRWEDDLPKVIYLRRKAAFASRMDPHLTQVVQVLESVNDLAIPLGLRLARLGSCLARLSDLVTIDCQLLALLAAARWLARVQHFSLARLALAEYQRLSFGLSLLHGDSMGMAQDILARSWYSNSSAESDASDKVADLLFKRAE